MTFTRTFLRVAFGAALLAVFVVSVLPAPYEPKIFSWQDKVQHLVVFGGLTLLGIAGWPRSPRAVAAGMLLYGIAMEVAQSMTAYRAGEFRDWIADALGVVAALAIVRLRHRLPRA